MSEVKRYVDIPENEQKKTIRNYLKKYKNIIYRIYALEKRKRIIEKNSIALQSPSLDSNPVQHSDNSIGAAAMTFRCAEIESEIIKSKSDAERAMDEIYKVINLLPSDSIERVVIEYRYIDCMNWNKIYPIMNYSKSRCHDYENAGLTMLLSFARVQEIVLQNYNQDQKEKERLQELGKEIFANKKTSDTIGHLNVL